MRVNVTAPPEDGRANEAVIALLAEALAVGKSRLTIVKGQKSRTKSVAVESLAPEEAGRRLEAACRK